MLNDSHLGNLGIPVLAAAAAGKVLLDIGGSLFGPGKDYLMRKAMYQQVDYVYDTHKATLPALPQWLQQVVLTDLNKFWQMTHPHNTLVDGRWTVTGDDPKLSESAFRAAFAFLEGREAAWNLMQAPAAGAPVGTVEVSPAHVLPVGAVEVSPSQFLQKRRIVTTITPSGAVVRTAAPAVVAEAAGFNWPVMLAVGGVLVWLLLGKK